MYDIVHNPVGKLYIKNDVKILFGSVILFFILSRVVIHSIGRGLNINNVLVRNTKYIAPPTKIHSSASVINR